MKLQSKGNPIPLPQGFTIGHDSNLTKKSMLENFPSYMQNMIDKHNNSFLEQLVDREYYKPKRRPPYSPEIICYALLLRHTSAQACKILLEKFPLPAFCLLKKIQSGKLDTLKALKTLLLKNKISQDIILMIDEMYLSKQTQYSNGEYIGADESGQFYKGIIVIMVGGLKTSVSVVIKARPEISLNGQDMMNDIDEILSSLSNIGFKVPAIGTDNHSSNVSAFHKLTQKYDSEQLLYTTS